MTRKANVIMDKSRGAPSTSSHGKTSRQPSPSLHGTGAVQQKIQCLLEKEAIIRKQGDHAKLNNTDLSCTPNLVWREKVAHWCYDVVDHLNESRSLVYVAMNMLDRYCAVSTTDGSTMDEQTYERASMTALFLAVRIAGSGNLCLQELTSMSRGEIQVRDIISMGTCMIKSLTWEHRIVTPLDFVGVWLGLISQDLRSQRVLDSACYLVEIAVCDASLSKSKASDVALAAVLNSLGAPRSIETKNFAKAVKDASGIVLDTLEFSSLCARLQGIYSQSAESSNYSGPHLVVDEGDEPIQAALCQSSMVVGSISSDDLVESCNKRQLDSSSSPSDPVQQLKRSKLAHDVTALE
jgi:hypothetical protein